MTRWQLFSLEAIAAVPDGALLVIRYPSSRCNIGLLTERAIRGVLLVNHVGTHFAEYKPNTPILFTVLDIPETDVVIRDSQLPLT